MKLSRECDSSILVLEGLIKASMGVFEVRSRIMRSKGL